MAQRAESLNFERSHGRLAPVIPVRVEKPPIDQTALAPLKHSLEAAYRRSRRQAERSYSFLVSRSNEVIRNVRHRVRRTRQERPLRTVGIAAGTAFILGLALRVGRSKGQ